MLPYRTALVTGASSGIGRAVAARLARAGVLVVLSARREDRLRELADTIARDGGTARVQPLDVADTDRTAGVIRALDAELGGLDLVIANAGVGVVGRGAARGGWESIAGSCHINFCGAAATLTAVLPQMIARRRGHLVGVSSIAAFGALPGRGGYCAPKAGLTMLLECLRLELRAAGVHVTAVHPGFVRTAMTERSRQWMPLIMEPDAVAEHIVRRLPSAPATIDFPRSLAFAARLGAHLPRALRDALLHRFMVAA